MKMRTKVEAQDIDPDFHESRCAGCGAKGTHRSHCTFRVDRHEATCYICSQFNIDYESDWSDETPGNGFSMRCWKGHFQYDQGDLVDETIPWHATITKARDCEDFDARRGPHHG